MLDASEERLFCKYELYTSVNRIQLATYESKYQHLTGYALDLHWQHSTLLVFLEELEADRFSDEKNKAPPVVK